MAPPGTVAPFGWWVDQVCMAVVVAVVGVTVVACELVRVVVYGPWQAVGLLWTTTPKKGPGLSSSSSSMTTTTVFVDAECAACSALRVFVAYRVSAAKRRDGAPRFASAQWVSDARTPEAQRLAALVRGGSSSASLLAEALQARLHAVTERHGDSSYLGGDPSGVSSPTGVSSAHRAQHRGGQRSSSGGGHSSSFSAPSSGTTTVSVGADVVLDLLASCHAPYPAVAFVARRGCPRALIAASYDVFARNRRAWFPTLAKRRPTTASKALSSPSDDDDATSALGVVDEAAQLRQVAAEGVWLSAIAVAAMTTVVLPLGDGKKDGPTQFAARCACAALIFFVALSLGREAASSSSKSSSTRADASSGGGGGVSASVAVKTAQGASPTTTTPSSYRSFEERYVGRASSASLAMMRVVAAFVLFLFTLPFFTAPLAETAQAPRFMCKPTGALRLLGEIFPSFFGKDTLLGDAAKLGALQTITRILLLLVALGAATPVSAPLAAILWLVYGGVLRSYNTWRGHSFIAAWWTLVVLAWRGGAGERYSLDAILFGRPKSLGASGAAGTTTTTATGGGSAALRAAQDRGWTRFMVTLVIANNYFMAGLSKFCASGVAWAFGANLKAKLLQTSLTQASFGVYLSLYFRHLPVPFWGFLGFCGLYGELAMGLVPFHAVAKLVFPTAMWGMHVGIIGLQHIVFIDLLTMIPSWYAWHAIDLLGEDRALYADGPWDWRRVVRDARDSLRVWRAAITACSCVGGQNNRQNKRLDDGDDDTALELGGEDGDDSDERALLSTSSSSATTRPHDALAGGPRDQAVQHRGAQNGGDSATNVNDANNNNNNNNGDDKTEDHHAAARRGARRASFLVLAFVVVWTCGAEWYPWNSFRMFADWTHNPIDYERYVARDANGRHLRNFHMHELNPVLNRKRFVDALETCARPRGPADDADCRAFLDFARPRALAMPGSPRYLVLETRLWDFEKDIDRAEYCDEMTEWEYDVQENRVARRDHVSPCDPIDWHTCCTRTIGTI